MNYIGIDMSLSSTGLFILKDDGTELYFNYKNNDKLSKWHKTLSIINYRNYKNIKSDKYSDSEVLKILQYDNITDIICKDILDNVKPEETIIVVEGYSYSSSNTSSLIDLVAYSSLLRSKLVKLPFCDFIVKAPMTLKVQTCMITYGPVIIEEKISKRKSSKPKKPKPLICKNRFGIAGGKFTKHDMLDAILDCKIQLKIKALLKPHQKELQLMKMIPKPIDDMVDSVWLVLSEKEKDII